MKIILFCPGCAGVKSMKKFLAELSGRKDFIVGLDADSLKLEKAVERAAKIAKVKIRPGEVFVVGDTHRSVQAAKEAGYHSAAVLDGFGDSRLLLRSSPELIAKEFSNMKPWLIWLGIEKDPKGVRRGTYICPDSPIEHAHYGRTGMDLRDIEISMKRLREAKKKVTGRSK